MSYIEAKGLTREYRRGAEPVLALDGVDFKIEQGEFIAIVGPSGSGKSTLLQLLGGMDRPTSGTLLVGGKQMAGLSDRELTRYRRDEVGFVFQDFGLLPVLTVEENVTLPQSISRGKDRMDVHKVLEQVGLQGRRRHRPSQLSGGEMQRVAIARALVNRPSLILADEPTGNLDSATGARIVELLHGLNREQGITLVIVTHNDEVAQVADRMLTLKDGRLQTPE